MLFFFKKIWSIQKFVVPLHPLLKKGRESVAQQVEHIPFKDGVLGSSPLRMGSWVRAPAGSQKESFGSLFCFLFSFLILSNSALQFCLQNYYKKSKCANKIHFILPFAGFCDRNFGGNVVAESEITTKNPNVQIKFILFCSLPDYTAFLWVQAFNPATTSRPHRDLYERCEVNFTLARSL